MATEAREQFDVAVEPMRLRDLGDILKIERLSFPTPWSRYAFLSELLENDRAYYLVARAFPVGQPRPRRARPVGYAGVWLVLDEGHVTNVAVHPDFRGYGIGRTLMEAVEDLVREKGGKRMTLEVRRTNLVAQTLYRSLGYKSAGVRRGYYRDNNEDAFIMWKDL
ncbi:ribosomal protein S18-alanine N-acetyltransferase [Limnochorda pilosa]|uniref:30S ribosomal protein S18 n=1 Tax=Limnochorda pilosa TaxID=1555112 RepID=A0A0K2SNV1_LIMPI|nr:30S ribosomal protein S18 [Limnochorda pilosa]